MPRLSLAIATFLLLIPASRAAEYTLHTFTKIRLTDKFWTEAATFGELKRDGHTDVVVGPYWHEGPYFKKRHEFYRATHTFKVKMSDGVEQTIEGYDGALGSGQITGFGDSLFVKIVDLNGDGRPDILRVEIPTEDFGHSKTLSWYENPGQEGLAKALMWKRHVLAEAVDNQSVDFIDLFSNGQPVLLCMSGGQVGYFKPDSIDPTRTWEFHRISWKVDEFQWYTHGLGHGDVNGDGRVDVLHSDGWWEQLKKNGDGELQFKRHLIVNKKPSENKYGIEFTEIQAVQLADIDGDDLKDIVTGKRFWGHGKCCLDPESNEAASLYWFKQVRHHDKTVEFIPYLIDADSGTQITVGDVNGDGRPDIVVANKKGAFVLIQNAKNVSQKEWEQAQPPILYPDVK